MPFRKGHIPLNKKNLDEQLVLDLYQNGLPGDPNGSSTNKIAAYLGCHKSLVSRIVKKYGMLRFRRLTEEEQAKAVTLYEQGLSGPAVAKQLGVRSTAVYSILAKHDIERRSVEDYDYEEPALHHDFFNQLDTPQKAYWLGMLLTDGCVSRNEIILSLAGKDARQVKLWRATIGSQAKLSRSIKWKTFGEYRWLCRTARLTIRSRQLTAALAKLGIIPAKTGRTTYPDVPERLARHFWRGVVDGDGWLTWAKSGKRRQLILGITGDQPLVEAFQAFCQQHVPTRATIQPNGNKVVKFVVTDWFAYHIAEILYGDGHTALSRKQRVFFKAKKILAGKERPVRNWLARPKEISA